MRLLQICRVLSKYLIFYKLTSHRHKIFGERLKLAFSELGLTFVKIGQILSMRYDLLSREDCEALQQLLDNVNPIPFEYIVKIVEVEYGKPLNQIFQTFEPIPLGSASVSQVHKAVTLDGQIVAVKIKRPDVDEKFLSDIKIIKRLAAWAQLLSPTLRDVQLTDLIKYFEAWIKQDLDFVLEVKNMKRIKEQYGFGDNKNFRTDLGKGLFIAPWENLCTKNIVVMDFINGIPMNRKQEILSNPDYDIEKSLKTYMNAAMRNWFRDDVDSYLFQADPHLSNILALPHGDAANIDCGLISDLKKSEAQICQKLIVAVYLQDLEKTIQIATQMTGVDYHKYKNVLHDDLKVYLEQTKQQGFGFWFMEFAKIMIKHKIKFPLFLTTFGRTNLILDGLMATYIPEQTTLDIVGEELKRQAIKQMLRDLKDINWMKLAYTITEKIRLGPDLIADFLDNPLELISKVAAAAKNN